jgi:hypothetical protein
VESAGRIGISTGFKKFFYGVGGQFSAQAATEDADDDPAEVINHIHISDVNALADAAGITSLLTLNSRRVCKEDWSFAMSISISAMVSYFFISSSIEINHRVQGLRITSAIVRPTIWRYGCFRERT